MEKKTGLKKGGMEPPDEQDISLEDMDKNDYQGHNEGSNEDDFENEECEVVEKRKRKSDGRPDNYLDNKNPFRTLSEIDLNETRKSFRWIETEVLLSLMKSGITSSDWSVFMYILHRTRGHCNKNKYYRHSESISIEDFIENTNLSKTTVYKSMNRLKKKQMIYEYTEGRSIMTGINFRYDTWM
jgi:predicted transcriptional regulator